MYRKKEFILTSLVLLVVIGFFLWPKASTNEEINESISIPSPIVIKIDGEVVRETKLYFSQAITYGKVIILIENICNEYSDLSGFNLSERIEKSKTITIPTTDINNNYQKDQVIHINYATKEELQQLAQIGEKRSQKIIDFIKENGFITSWELLWKITSVPDAAKEIIIKQAVL